MEVALRRRLDGVADIRISQERQTAEVRFAPGPYTFSASEFRAAVAEAEVEVVRFEIDVCGQVEDDGAAGWLAAGTNRFRLLAPTVPLSGSQCLRAILDDRVSPPDLERLELLSDGSDGRLRR